MPVVPVISASGGAGKTTLSLLLAYVLVKHVGVDPKRVLLIDLDPTAGLTLRVFGDETYDEMCKRRKTLYHMDLDSKVKNVRVEDYVSYPGRFAEALSNVAVLPPGEDDGGDLRSRIEDWFKYGDREALIHLLERAGALSQYYYVIIDTAPFFDVKYTVAAAVASKRVVVPLRPTVTDITRTKRMVSALRSHNLDVDPVFIFNFDKDKHVTEAATLVSLNIRVPAAKRVNPNPKLREHIAELENYGNVVKSAIVYRKEISDAVFPRESPSERNEIAVCGPVVELLKAIGINAPECPDYEED